MKFHPKVVDQMGNLVCAGMLDLITQHKMPQIVFAVNNGQQVRMVLIDNAKVEMSKEEIQNRMASLKNAPGQDVGFSYTINGLRVIVVPEEMTILPVLGAPLGTPFG